jgi:ketosteroid isomerase-like protein
MLRHPEIAKYGNFRQGLRRLKPDTSLIAAPSGDMGRSHADYSKPLHPPMSEISTAEAIVVKHFEIAAHGTLDELMADYADNAVLIGPDGTLYEGKAQVRAGFAAVMEQDPRPSLNVTSRVFLSNVGYLQWTMHDRAGRAFRGSDTFVIADGKIVLQTAVMFPDD